MVTDRRLWQSYSRNRYINFVPKTLSKVKAVFFLSHPKRREERKKSLICNLKFFKTELFYLEEVASTVKANTDDVITEFFNGEI